MPPTCRSCAANLLAAKAKLHLTAGFGPKLAEVGPLPTRSSQRCSDSVRVGPTSTESGQQLPGQGKSRDAVLHPAAHARRQRDMLRARNLPWPRPGTHTDGPSARLVNRLVPTLCMGNAFADYMAGAQEVHVRRELWAGAGDSCSASAWSLRVRRMSQCWCSGGGGHASWSSTPPKRGCGRRGRSSPGGSKWPGSSGRTRGLT